MKRALFLLALLGCRSQSSPPPTVHSAGGLTAIVPTHARGPLRIARGAAYLELEALDIEDAVARIDGDRIRYATEGTLITQEISRDRIEETRRVEAHAKSLAYRVHLGPGLASLRVVGDFVEALDDRGVALLRTEPAFLVDARGVRRDLHPTWDGTTLRWSIDDAGLSYPLDIDPAWTLTTSLAQPRRDNPTHLLPSGKVITFGGTSLTGRSLSTVEIWDPATKSWTFGTPMKKPRAVMPTALLPSGKVWIGGANDSLTTAEIYDPVAGTSTLIATDAPIELQAYSRTAVLSPSLVLIVNNGTAALFDVSTSTWTEVGQLTPRDLQPAVVTLASGKVLMAGGTTKGLPVTTTEIFDPATKDWTAAAPMKEKRSFGDGVLLPTGKVLVAGGTNGVSSAEIYDPIADTWTLTPPMTGAHSFCSIVLLTSGKALMAGGDMLAGLSDRADLYDPIANAWSFAGKLINPVDEYGIVPLPGGKALIAGGSNGIPVATTEIFDPQGNGKPCLGPGECSSGFCVDGACCEKSSCAMGLTCGGSAAPGTCLAKDGATCTKDTECGSGHCVDGVCCETACTEQCAACNLKGSEGKCAAVPAGDAPHAPRSECGGEGACRGRCGGVDKAKCTQFPGTPVICAEPKCEGGSETAARGCDGAGACAPAAPKSCGTYVCGATACKTDCSEDKDCIDGNTCDLVTRKCVIAATCENEETVKSPDGATKSCVPFKCAAGRCLDTCKDSSACSAGYVCDVTSGRCTPGAPVQSDDGGCTYGHSETGGWLLIALLLLNSRRARLLCCTERNRRSS